MPYTYFFAFLLLLFLGHSAAQGEMLKDEDLQNFFTPAEKGLLIDNKFSGFKALHNSIASLFFGVNPSPM